MLFKHPLHPSAFILAFTPSLTVGLPPRNRSLTALCLDYGLLFTL
jgi:hypothetical protein